MRRLKQFKGSFVRPVRWNLLHPENCCSGGVFLNSSGEQPRELVSPGLKVHRADMAFLSWTAVSYTDTPGTALQSGSDGGRGGDGGRGRSEFRLC